MATKWGDREARRGDILDAGRRLLADRGYAALQMRDVAKGAGISPGTVYTYFTTKEALYAALYAERLTEFAAKVEPLCAESADPEELFVAICTEYLRMYQVYGQELNIWAVLAGEVDVEQDVGGQLAIAAGRVYDLVLTAVDRLRLTEPGAAEVDSDMVVTMLWAVVTGLADHFTSVRHYLRRRGWDETVRFTARTLIAGLRRELEEE
ncbi:AcrR family transcriptional regulator [Nocardia transvalensis]|uniref:AcrR family transcriptional regulator n=1 Tax=Nocardia transvalensis TaxID=37333 RepID=A0A7W9PFE2_9NOCA|nr:TetR/AcrR family transcriptional regulator [Nocardia transvalensis]MBB5915142.1 AcrR family transcriptional regulator [Nocardia transvalensis]